MNILSNKKLVNFYLLIALGYAVLGLLSNISLYPRSWFESAINNVWMAIYILVVNYIFFEYSIPFALRKRKYSIVNIIVALLLLFLHLMLWSYGSYLWKLTGIKIHIYTILNPVTSVNKELTVRMAYSAGAVVFFGVARHIYNYVQLKQQQQQLKIEKQASELNFLRSQTNPHFLFNTLNNIYALTKIKSDLAPESVLRLSKLLRFMLYETGGEFIAIESEIKIIDDYIELEKLRYDETLQVSARYDLEDLKQTIPPLLLIPLVENAFKHGVSESTNTPYVDIRLSVKNSILNFIVKNSTETTVEDFVIKENIGLSNLRRQLELLYRKYDLDVKHSTNLFTATLKIDLSSHV